MSKQCLLTTIDNPYDPFEQFDDWFRYDTEFGYDCCSKVARIANVSEDMSDEEYLDETEKAIDAIIQHDFTNTYKKVTKELRDYPEDDTD
mgnify:CR=1 FL=1